MTAFINSPEANLQSPGTAWNSLASSVDVLQPFGWMLIHSTWQLALIALMFFAMRAIIRFALPRNNATAVYCCGCFCLFSMLMVTAGTFVLSGDNSKPVSHALPSVSADVIAPESETMTSLVHSNNQKKQQNQLVNVSNNQFSLSTLAAPQLSFVQQAEVQFYWLVPLWIVGVALLSLRPILGLWNVRWLASNGLSDVPEAVSSLGQRMIQRLGIERTVRFAISNRISVPTVVGFIKPIILLPSAVLSGLTLEQLELILAHELAHVRRNDYVINLLQTVVESILFYHPATWIVSAQIRLERENCCDDAAVAHLGNGQALAHALMKLEQTRSSLPPALAASGNNSGALINRIRRLINQPSKHTVTKDSVCVTAVLVAILTGAALFASAGSSTIAQETAAPQNLLQTQPQALPQFDNQNGVQQSESTPVPKAPSKTTTHLKHPSPDQVKTNKPTRVFVIRGDMTSTTATDGKDHKIVALKLAAGKNDIFNALMHTGGLPGKSAQPLIYVARSSNLSAEDKSTIESGIPWLCDIPYINRLFKNVGVKQPQREIKVPVALEVGRVFHKFKPEDVVLYSDDIVYVARLAENKKSGTEKALSVYRKLQSTVFRSRAEAERLLESAPDVAIKIVENLAEMVEEASISEGKKAPLLKIIDNDLTEMRKYIAGQIPPRKDKIQPTPRSYFVGDLIVPTHSAFARHAKIQNQQQFLQAIPKALRQKQTGNPIARLPDKTGFTVQDSESLINLIKNTVNSADNINKNGSWKVDFHASYLSLIVIAPSGIHNEIQILLKELREQADVSIELQSWIVTFPRDDLQLSGVQRLLAEDNPGPLTKASGRVLRNLRAFAKTKQTWQTHDFESYALFNGQQVALGWEGFKTLEPGYISFQTLLPPLNKVQGKAKGTLFSNINISTVNGLQLEVQTTQEQGNTYIIDLSSYLSPKHSNNVALFIYKPIINDDSRARAKQQTSE